MSPPRIEIGTMTMSEKITSLAELATALQTRLITGSPVATENDSPKSRVNTETERFGSCVATESRSPSDSVTCISRSGDAVPPAIFTGWVAGRDIRYKRHDDEQNRQRDKCQQ